MTALVTAIITLIEAELPSLMSAATAATITQIIAILEQAIPIAIQVGEALVTPIKNIIAALRTSGAVTPEQLDQLDAQEAALDAAFDDAAEAAEAEDAKANSSGT